jgi:hypothetical protein
LISGSGIAAGSNARGGFARRRNEASESRKQEGARFDRETQFNHGWTPSVALIQIKGN